MVTQNGVPFFQPDELISSVGIFTQAVRRRRLLRGGDPDLCRRPHGDGLGERRTRNCASSRCETIAERYGKAGRFKTKYWTPEVHVAAFALPRFIAEAREERAASSE